MASEALASIRAAIDAVRMEHTCCEMFPEHFSPHDKPCPMPLFAGALDEAVKALEKIGTVYRGGPAAISIAAFLRIASKLEGK
jgi:hypothetical protein